MEKDYTESPILITGCARSGTSMIGGIIHKCGAWKGETRGPTKYNQKGMFENKAMVTTLVKPYLRELGFDRNGQYPLPETSDIKIPTDFRERVFNILKEEGWTPDQPWMWKCVKMTLMWPVWHYAFPNTKWIIVRRKSSDIVNSCMKTGFMKAYQNVDIQKKVGAKTEQEGWLWWIRQHEEKWVEMMQKGLNVKVVWPQRMFEHDYAQMKETIEWLGLEYDSKAVLDFIEPKFWHARKKQEG